MSGRTQKNPVLVLGATGKVGRMMTRIWAGRTGKDIEIKTVFRDATADDNGLVWAPGKNPRILGRARAIVALWGVTPGNAPDLDQNTALAIAAMELAQSVGADRVLHCSSAAVYGGTPGALTEGSGLSPPHPYGLAKMHMEQAIEDWRNAHPEGPASCALRIGNVAGAESLFATLKRGGPVTLHRFADGQGPSRSYIGPEEMVQIAETLMKLPVSELPSVLNVGAPAATTMEGLARAAGRDVVWQDAPEGAQQRVVLDTTRLQSLCRLDPRASDPAWLVRQWQDWGDDA